MHVAVSFFSVTVAKEPEVIGDPGDIKPRDIHKAKQFVINNLTSLMAIWNQDIGASEVQWQQAYS